MEHRGARRGSQRGMDACAELRSRVTKVVRLANID
jgi:hypothetical protein